MTVAGHRSTSTALPAIRPPLIDPFERAITYLRVSVTDRCDFRCVYCMSENMTFLPKADLLTLEELDRLCSAFVAKGVRKLRLTGGEPLVRRGIMTLVSSLSRHLEHRRARRADAHHQRLAACEIRRASSRTAASSASTFRSTRSIPDKFRAITRWGDLAQGAGRHRRGARRRACKVKINAVALKGVNEDEFADLVDWAHGRGMDLTLIEVMPLGDVGEGRLDQYLPLSMVRAQAGRALHARRNRLPHRRAGALCARARDRRPARLHHAADAQFLRNPAIACGITCTGTLYMCLGQEDAADLRAPLRASEGERSAACGHRRSHRAQAQGPRLHHRPPPQAPAVARHMSVTGG